jgi:hypothetical protein
MLDWEQIVYIPSHPQANDNIDSKTILSVRNQRLAQERHKSQIIQQRVFASALTELLFRWYVASIALSEFSEDILGFLLM